MAPGHPPRVNMTTSHKLSSSVFGFNELVGEVYSNFGKKTLNIVYPSIRLEKQMVEKQASTHLTTFQTTLPKLKV